jgi:Tfp pilus assembly protein PilO
MNDLKKFYRTYKSLVISVGILLACGAALLLGIIPLIQTTIGLDAQRRVQAIQVGALQQKLTVLQSMDEGKLRQDLQMLLSAVPSDKSLGTVFSTVDGLSTQTGLSIDSFSITKPGSLSTASAQQLTVDEQAVGSNIVPVSIHFTGTLDQIRTFLTSAVLVRRFLRIRSIDINLRQGNSAPVASSSGTMASVSMTIDAFYSPIPSSIGSVSQAIDGLKTSDTDIIAKVAAIQLITPPSAGLSLPSSTGLKPDPFSL